MIDHRLGIKYGDWLIIALSALCVVWSFKALWHQSPASQLQIRQADKIVGVYDLKQTRELHLHEIGRAHV